MAIQFHVTQIALCKHTTGDEFEYLDGPWNACNVYHSLESAKLNLEQVVRLLWRSKFDGEVHYSQDGMSAYFDIYQTDHFYLFKIVRMV